MIFSQKRQFKIYAHTDVELLQLDKDDYQKRLNFSFRKVANEIRERAESRRVKQIKMYEKAQKKWEDMKERKKAKDLAKIGQGLGKLFEDDSYPLLSQVRYLTVILFNNLVELLIEQWI